MNHSRCAGYVTGREYDADVAGAMESVCRGAGECVDARLGVLALASREKCLGVWGSVLFWRYLRYFRYFGAAEGRCTSQPAA